MNPFLEDKDHWLFIRTVNGDYKQISGEQKVPTEATLLASPIPKGVKIPLSDGRIVKSDKLTEADMALLDDPDLPPYNPESPRYNPQAYPYSNEQMQRFVEFYKQGRYLNLTNTAKPLEEHCVVIPNNKVKEPTYKVVKLKDVPKQYQNRLRTPPFDPDLLLLTDRGQVKTAGELIDRSATWLFSESADANYRMLSHSVIRNYKASSLLERMEFLNSVSGR